MSRILVLITFFCFSMLSLSSFAQESKDGVSSARSMEEWINQYKEDADKKENNMDASIILKRAVEFRNAMASDVNKALKDFSANLDGFAIILESKPNQEVPAIWNYFFSTSIILAGNTLSRSPLVAYYNPFLDGVAYVQWGYKGKLPIPYIMASDAFEADTIGEASVPRWLAKGGTPMALMRGYQSFRSDFEDTYPLKGSSPSELPRIVKSDEKREIVEARALRALLELATILKTDIGSDIRGAWDVLRKAMQDGDMEKLASILPANNIMSPEQTLQIPKQVRTRLEPAYVVISQEMSLLYQQVETAPRFLGALGVINDSGLPAEKVIQSFVFFSLDSSLKTR